MILFTFDEIQQALDEKFIPLEPMLIGFRMLPQTAASPLGKWFDQRGVALPGGLGEIASRFDLGMLTIGPVTFGSRGNYAKDLDFYNDEQSTDEREFVTFASSDPFSYALAAKDGAVYTIDPEKKTPEGPIASSVEQFLRGVGTIFLRRIDATDKLSLADNVAVAVGAADQRFWRWLAS